MSKEKCLDKFITLPDGSDLYLKEFLIFRCMAITFPLFVKPFCMSFGFLLLLFKGEVRWVFGQCLGFLAWKRPAHQVLGMFLENSCS